MNSQKCFRGRVALIGSKLMFRQFFASGLRQFFFNCHSIEHCKRLTQISTSFVVEAHFFVVFNETSTSRNEENWMKFRSNATLITVSWQFFFFVFLSPLKGNEINANCNYCRPRQVVELANGENALRGNDSWKVDQPVFKLKVKNYATRTSRIISSCSLREENNFFYCDFATVKTCSCLISLFLR